MSMPGSGTMCSPRDGTRWYHANNPSAAVPDGLSVGSSRNAAARWLRATILKPFEKWVCESGYTLEECLSFLHVRGIKPLGEPIVTPG
jgi:hypothetical protein